MKRANQFIVQPNWKLMLIDMNIDPQLALAHANLPADLFNKHQPSVNPAEYFRLWDGVEKASGLRDLPLLLAKNMKAENFDPPIFACLCSPNLNTALSRLSQYKPLIGPMTLDLVFNHESTKLVLGCYGHDSIPASFSLVELVFFTQLARIATREPIQPMLIELPELPSNIGAYRHFFGCELVQSDQVAIEFKHQDATRPFLTHNAPMWEFFEDKLNQKLADLDANASTVERIRAVLIESLPIGESKIEDVAAKLTMSKRTLQRKLYAEAASYQGVLQDLRCELADHYLQESRISLGEIAFLLGFNETNSFIRAYSGWKGVSPGQFRNQYH